MSAFALEGPYTVDPANKFGSITLWTQKQGGIATGNGATTNNGKWAATNKALPAGQYDTWGELLTWDPANKKFLSSFTKTVNVTVK